MHGAGVTDTLGAGCILGGLVLQAGVSLVAVKVLMIMFLGLVTSPTATHVLAMSARTHGLRPRLVRGDAEEAESSTSK